MLYSVLSFNIILKSLSALVISFVICYTLFPLIIKTFRNYKVKQIIRHDGPSTHIMKKTTPTIGGIVIIISVIISTVLLADLNNKFIIWFLIGTIYFGCLGFFDDYLKYKRNSSKGISAKHKMLIQIVFASCVACYLFFFPVNLYFATLVVIPFFNNLFIQLSFLYYILAIIIIVGSSNAVNLTDGLDGLAIGNVIIVAFTFSIITYCSGIFDITKVLHIVYISQCQEISIYLMSIVGAGLGFLWYNSYPAEIFMGDTGSLFLGGVLGMTSLFLKQELLLVIVGGVFVIEAISVLLQVYFYKQTCGKRIFKMAPLHHHFELLGLNETKITIRFWIIGIILAVFSLISICL
ncbi:MAG: phospho-N-acetylmuramoyl-pentapeptide-transferase [Endomicrobium sp.]|jgi:phospho-N-acetylmuramoyl-pentapeptide-transferase|nr:phospho-N-acetylmuramoyl-pentapeptide-transferase [Endomicrobium sp.]